MYAEYADYKNLYGGNLIAEEEFGSYVYRASVFIDGITQYRIKDYPPAEKYQDAIKMAVCAVAEEIATIDSAKRNGKKYFDSVSDGKASGRISSITSGSESISYSKDDNGLSTAYSNFAVDSTARDKHLYDVAAQYLAFVPSGNGLMLLYAGGGRYVR